MRLQDLKCPKGGLLYVTQNPFCNSRTVIKHLLSGHFYLKSSALSQLLVYCDKGCSHEMTIFSVNLHLEYAIIRNGSNFSLSLEYQNASSYGSYLSTQGKERPTRKYGCLTAFLPMNSKFGLAYLGYILLQIFGFNYPIKCY